MQFIVNYGIEEPRNVILDQKIKEIRSYDDFITLQEKYGWLPCVAAFHATWGFNENWVSDQLAEFFFEELLTYAIENRIEEKINHLTRPMGEWNSTKPNQPDDTI